MELKSLITEMAGLMSVTGWETYDSSKLVSLIGDGFDETFADEVGNRYFVRRSGVENAPKILIDAHMDEIGLFVSDILEGGFLRVVNAGGVDTRLLQASDVVIYGREKLYGVVASTPPHLQKPGDAKNLKEIGELLIDTGYPKEELEELVRIGTPIGFYPKYTELLGGNIAGKGFDDKACAACAVHGIGKVAREELAGDIYLLLSVHEEIGGAGGAAAGCFKIDPDYAMVVDVNLGKTPDTQKTETVVMGGGPSITISAITDKKMTRMLAGICETRGIKYQYSVSPSHTGTNAPAVAMCRAGVPTIDVGLPLKSMHTYNEVLRLDDAEALSELVAAFVSSKEIAEVYGNAKA